MSRRPNVETRERILESAHNLFYNGGFKGVSMDDVAQAAGVKKANLFHYFPTKEALALAVFDRATAGMKERMTAHFSVRRRDPIVAVARMFEDAASRMRRSGCTGGCFVGNMAQEMSDGNERIRLKVSEHLRFWAGQLASHLERGRTRGYFRPELEVERAAEAILSLFEGALLYSKASREPGAVESAKRMAVGYLEAFRVGTSPM